MNKINESVQTVFRYYIISTETLREKTAKYK